MRTDSPDPRSLKSRSPAAAYEIIEGDPENGRRLQVTVPTIHRMVLDGTLSPGVLVATPSGCAPRPISEQPELVPAVRMRKRIVKLFAAHRHEEALESIDRFYAFDPHGTHPERVYVLFMEALIRGECEPLRAIQLYRAVLSWSKHDLSRVVHNNLAVLRCRLQDLGSALEHVQIASAGAPLFLTALANHQTILDRLSALRLCRQVPDATIDLRALETARLDVHNRLRTALEHGNLNAELDGMEIPGEEFALLIMPEELPGSLSYPYAQTGANEMAQQCLERGRAALEGKNWDAAVFWARETARCAPEDPVLTLEASRLEEVAESASLRNLRAERLDQWKCSLERLVELESTEKYQEAEYEIASLAAAHPDSESHGRLAGWSHRLRRTAVERDAQHECGKRLAAWVAERDRFESSLEHKRLEEARGHLQRLWDVAGVLGFEVDARDMERRLDRAAAEADLASALESLDKDDLDVAERFALSAESRHSDLAPRAQRVLRSIEERRTSRARDELLRIAVDDGPGKALERLVELPPRFLESPHLVRLSHVLVRLTRSSGAGPTRADLERIGTALATSDVRTIRELVENAGTRGTARSEPSQGSGSGARPFGNGARRGKSRGRTWSFIQKVFPSMAGRSQR